MVKSIASSATHNQILAHLSASDFALLAPNLKLVDLPTRFSIEDHNKPVRHIYFVEHGIVSVVSSRLGKRSVEVGIIGAEGMTGLSVVMGAERPTNDTFVQLAGAGFRISAANLRAAITQSAALHYAFLRYAHDFMTQTADTVVANARGSVEQRLARWLLMANDRVGGSEVALTHEFLAIMLGVRRPGVTEAVRSLESDGMVRGQRGIITIIDRERLIKRSNGVYLVDAH